MQALSSGITVMLFALANNTKTKEVLKSGEILLVRIMNLRDGASKQSQKL
jgi:hypothetical protein